MYEIYDLSQLCFWNSREKISPSPPPTLLLLIKPYYYYYDYYLNQVAIAVFKDQSISIN